MNRAKPRIQALVACAQTRVELTIAGKIIDKHWNNIQNEYDNVYLDEYIIMPNHIHGVVIIEKERAQTSSAPTIGQIIRSFKSKSGIEYLNWKLI